jgi:hypothetical protein
VTLHLRLENGADPMRAISEAKAMLREHLRIEHSTIEIALEPAGAGGDAGGHSRSTSGPGL